MVDVQSIGSTEAPYFQEDQEENLEKGLESLSDYLLFSNSTGWPDDYGAYLILKEIFSHVQDPNVKTAFDKFEKKVEEFAKKQFFFTWNHVELSQLIDEIQYQKPTICSQQLKLSLIACLNNLLPQIDDACSGMMNNQFSLSKVFAQLTAIGFILRDTELSKDLQSKGEAITATWFFSRFGDVATGLKLEVNELIDLLS